MIEKIKKNRPGRPEGSGDNASERILDAAEYEFSENGYSGTVLRLIAHRAGVTQALVSYYFGSKQGLYESVFMRRSKQIADERETGLLSLFSQEKEPTVEGLVEAFLKPTLSLRETEEGRRFLRLQARLHTEPEEIAYRLREMAYNNSTKKYIDALGRICPNLTPKDRNWKVVLMIGAYLYAFSDTHRLEQIAPGVCDVNNTEEILNQITLFVSAGIKAQ